MLGLFGILNLGTRSLQAQQVGVETAGQNLANVNNPAYARQRVNLQTTPTINSAIGQQGTGAEVVAIQQIRDMLLDGQIRDEASVGGYWEAQQGGLQSTQTGLNEFLDQSASSINGAADAGSAAGAQGLSTQLTQLFNAFQSVAANPTSLPERQALVNQAQTLAGSFNQIDTRLSAIHDTLNTSVGNDVTSANQLLSEVADLNKSIAEAELPGRGTANDLRDLREQKLESLAQLVNIQTGTAADGSINVTIGGQTLVSGRQVLDSLQTYDAGGGQLLVRTATGGSPLTLTGGSIQGNIDARDGALQTLRTGLDTLAGTLVTQVNTLYRSGYSLSGTTGADFFTGTDAASIQVNAALANDPAQVQAAGSAGAASDNAVALALAQLARQPNAALGNQTFKDAYSQLVVKVGTALSSANSQLADHNAISAMLLNRRDSVSGVSLEEEMSSLLSFQKAYQASAKIITTVDQMLETVLSLKS
ncbi:MAG TPA: flagellar hook-associated protein FlgK [Candidatus Sulfotelmatobacter sp.]|nr:flagellar hook-associated protein FlgK [Candidatus Sulfotelmatobacter sp.]HWI57391.1 flagellar hook-associated protein FlgK [Bacillota bacterium]